MDNSKIPIIYARQMFHAVFADEIPDYACIIKNVDKMFLGIPHLQIKLIYQISCRFINLHWFIDLFVIYWFICNSSILIHHLVSRRNNFLLQKNPMQTHNIICILNLFMMIIFLHNFKFIETLMLCIIWECKKHENLNIKNFQTSFQ